MSDTFVEKILESLNIVFFYIYTNKFFHIYVCAFFLIKILSTSLPKLTYNLDLLIKLLLGFKVDLTLSHGDESCELLGLHGTSIVRE